MLVSAHVFRRGFRNGALSGILPPMTFSPETNPVDATRVAAFAAQMSDTELTQATASPRALVGRLEGMTINHLRTGSEAVIIAILRAEERRRSEDRVDRLSQNAFWVYVVAAGVAVFALAVSFLSWWMPHDPVHPPRL